MKQKINIRLVQIAVLAVLATLVSMTLIYYTLYQRQVRKDLSTDAQILKDTGIFDKGRELNRDLYIDQDDLRITWIDTDGTVLYDNDANADMLANHSDRPEFKDALSKGKGECVRISDTMKMNTFYYALRLQDGTVLRVATKARSIFSVFLTSAPVICLILVAIVFLCVILARFLTKQLLQPIENMAENMEDTTRTPPYKELIPFVHTIRAQHENILMAAKVRQDFTANVSHELKTPLAAISGYAEIIENHMVDAEQEIGFAREIQHNADRLLSLINDIIRLSELDNSDGNVISYEQIDLDEVVRDCIKGLQVSAEKRNVSLYYEGENCEIRADRGMMSELVENLCQNAIRYNNEGGEVHIKVTHENGSPFLIVSDNGIGIPKDQQERIFERFYRVDKSRSKQTGGTGLGLAIVKHIVELHDAKITLDSELGKGTTVCVEF